MSEEILREMQEERRREIEALEEFEDLEEDNEPMTLSAQDMLDTISVEEELKRIEKFDEEFVVSKDTMRSEFYQTSRCKIETFIYLVKLMVESGIDYNNSVSIINNMIVANDNLELAKAQTQSI